MSEHQKREALRQVIVRMGLIPEVTEYGNFLVYFEGSAYLIRFDPEDTEFISITRSIALYESAISDRAVWAKTWISAYNAALASAAGFKCAKVQIELGEESGEAKVVAESFVSDIEECATCLLRLLRSAAGVTKYFAEEFERCQESGEEGSTVDEVSDRNEPPGALATEAQQDLKGDSSSA